MSRNTTETHVQLPPTQLDPDERRILGECEQESLIYRSIPLGLTTFFATQYAMSRNMITTKGRWIKLSAALFTGYILGKVSYASACRKKILTQIPNSNLAYAIRGDGIQQQSTQDENVPKQFMSNESYGRKEPAVFLSDSVDHDSYTVPIGVNQYGDPIYESTK